MSKITTQAIRALFASYDAGTRTKSMLANASEKSIARCIELGFMNDAQFDAFKRHAALPTGKVAMLQVAKAIDFIATGDVSSIDTATAALIIVAFLNEAGTKPQRFENARMTLKGSGAEGTRPLDGINAASLRKAVGAITNMSTVSAQVSRTVGVNGTLGIMQATNKVSKHEFQVLPNSRENPFLLQYCKALSKLPEGVLIAKFVKDEA